MYFDLFNHITDAIVLLQAVQQRGEDAYIETMENELLLLPQKAHDEPR